MKRHITRVSIPAGAHDLFVPMPSGADLLSVGFQDGALCVWCMSNVGAGMNRVRLLVLPDGAPVDLPDGMDIVLLGRAEKQSTLTLGGRPPVLEVFHVFQIVSAPICD